MAIIQLFRRLLRLEKQSKVHQETLSTSCQSWLVEDTQISRVYYIDQHNRIVRKEEGQIC